MLESWQDDTHEQHNGSGPGNRQNHRIGQGRTDSHTVRGRILHECRGASDRSSESAPRLAGADDANDDGGNGERRVRECRPERLAALHGCVNAGEYWFPRIGGDVVPRGQGTRHGEPRVEE